MNIRRVLIAAFASAAVVIGVSSGIVYAASSSQIVTGTWNRSVYRAADTLTINGTVNGDVFCAGQTITIDATVNGDVICAGQDVTVDGTVNGNVRVTGQVVHLDASVLRSATLVGQDVTVSSSAKVGNDLTLLSQTATVNGPVGRDITGTVAVTTLNGAVGRNVDLRANTLTLQSGAAVVGNLTYAGPNKLQNNGGQVHGTVTYRYAPAHHNNFSFSGVGYVWFGLFWLIAMIVLAIILVAIFPQVFRRWNPSSWGSDFWWAVLTGFIAMLAVPIIIVVCMLTVIGIPLGLLILFLWLAAALLSMPLAAYFAGSQIVPKWHPIALIVIGGVVLGIIELIPFIGWLVGLIAYWLGTGILLLGLKRHYPNPAYHSNGSMES
jgi:cytoskeletal protein CcmA (bactofilin family)